MSGYFAVQMWYNDRDPQYPFWEPWRTGIGRYKTREEAEAEAKQWAENEKLEFKP